MHHEDHLKNIIRKILFLLLTVFLLSISAEAQWVGSPEKNTLLVTNCFNPVNISAVDDGLGGFFIFWEDNLNGFQEEVSFLHVNAEGIASFRTDGKKISSSETPEFNPFPLKGPSGTAYIIWRERLRSNSDQLFIQKVSSSGALIWRQEGVPVSTSGKLISDYSGASDNSGNAYLAYINSDADEKGNYIIRMQGINSSGEKIFQDEITAAASGNKKNSLALTANDSGGVHIFWLETINNKNILCGQSIDRTGKPVWGSRPVEFSSGSDNIFSFSAKKFKSSVYLVWQLQKTDKDLYHQLVGKNGKEIWQKHGVPVVPLKGNQTNPQSQVSGDNIILTWTDDAQGDRNIFAQKYNTTKGEALWNNNSVKVIGLNGDQFGQRVLSDGKDGVVITWIDRRVNAVRGNIYAQRIDANGKLLWDSLGIQVASTRNTEKSYLSVIADYSGGVVVIFKEKRNGRNEIYGHKIYNTGTSTSQVIAFNTELLGDSVKVSWYSANELSRGKYIIERTITEQGNDNWEKVREINSEGRASARYYEHYDKPESTGTIYYRVVQVDRNGNTQPSDIARIDYFGKETSVFVAQNSPNPFKDATRIGIYLPHPGKVRIEFFDSRVEKIKEITEEYPSGLSQVEFSAEGLKPGIYFYKVHAGEFVDVKKMVVAN